MVLRLLEYTLLTGIAWRRAENTKLSTPNPSLRSPVLHIFLSTVLHECPNQSQLLLYNITCLQTLHHESDRVVSLSLHLTVLVKTTLLDIKHQCMSLQSFQWKSFSSSPDGLKMAMTWRRTSGIICGWGLFTLETRVSFWDSLFLIMYSRTQIEPPPTNNNYIDPNEETQQDPLLTDSKGGNSKSGSSRGRKIMRGAEQSHIDRGNDESECSLTRMLHNNRFDRSSSWPNVLRHVLLTCMYQAHLVVLAAQQGQCVFGQWVLYYFLSQVWCWTQTTPPLCRVTRASSRATSHPGKGICMCKISSNLI